MAVNDLPNGFASAISASSSLYALKRTELAFVIEDDLPTTDESPPATAVTSRSLVVSDLRSMAARRVGIISASVETDAGDSIPDGPKY